MIKTIIFDLGKVIIDFDIEKALTQLADVCRTEPQQMRQFLLGEKLFWKFERGDISEDDLYNSIVDRFKGNPTKEDVYFAVSNIFTTKPEMEALLIQLKELNYQLQALSNTNSFHIRYIRDNFSFLESFDHLVFSHEAGHCKPEPEIYKVALEQTKSNANECFFTDDLVQNIEAATSLGINGHIFTNKKSLLDALDQFNIRLDR